jgi:hypothetical protein
MSATNFYPAGSTLAANVTTSSFQGLVTGNASTNKWMVVNTGTSPVFFRISSNLSLTTSSIAIPTTGSSAPGQMINAGDSIIIGLPTADDNQAQANFVSTANFVATSAATGTNMVYVTPVQNNQW